MFFWNSLAFLMTPWMLAIWSLVPLPFLNPAWTSRSSWFTHWIYCSPPQKTGWKKLVTFALQANPSIYIWTDTEKHSFKFDVLSNFASVAFVLCVIHLSGMPHRGSQLPDRGLNSCSVQWNLKHWTTKEVPALVFITWVTPFKCSRCSASGKREYWTQGHPLLLSTQVLF